MNFNQRIQSMFLNKEYYTNSKNKFIRMKIFYTIILSLYFFSATYATDNYLYTYKIVFTSSLFQDKTTEAKELIKKFAHANNVTLIEDDKSFEFTTIYKINTNIFIGKFQKFGFNIEQLILKKQEPIYEELRDKIDKEQKLREKEILDADKQK